MSLTYIQPHMTKALEQHQLGKLLSVGSVQMWHLGRHGTRVMSIQLTFTQEGIALQGDLRLGHRGLCSDRGYGVGWFGTHKSESYLCEKFLPTRWQQEVARRQAEEWAVDAEDGALQVTCDRHAEMREVCGPDCFEDFGMDYPLADAGWLCALQSRFVALYQEQL